VSHLPADKEGTLLAQIFDGGGARDVMSTHAYRRCVIGVSHEMTYREAVRPARLDEGDGCERGMHTDGHG